MPFNKIHVPENLPTKTCHAINQELHDSLGETCNVNPDDFFCLICRYEPDDMILHPTFLGKRDPHGAIIIEIALLAGRKDIKKETLFKAVRRRLETIGFEPMNSIMFLLENQPIDWSFGPEGSIESFLEPNRNFPSGLMIADSARSVAVNPVACDRVEKREQQQARQEATHMGLPCNLPAVA